MFTQHSDSAFSHSHPKDCFLGPHPLPHGISHAHLTFGSLNNLEASTSITVQYDNTSWMVSKMTPNPGKREKVSLLDSQGRESYRIDT